MKNLKKFTSMLFWIGVFAVNFCTFSHARDLPEIVDVGDLSAAHDYKRVSLQTWVKSGREVRTRRLDGQYTELIVGTSGGRDLMVVMNEELFGRIINECVLIQGIYRTGGRFGGRLLDADFVVADAVIVDLSGEFCTS